jgi:hypothetical protein
VSALGFRHGSGVMPAVVRAQKARVTLVDLQIDMGRQ